MDQEHESKKEDFLLREQNFSSREKRTFRLEKKKFSSSRRRKEVGEESNTQEIGRDERSELTW